MTQLKLSTLRSLRPLATKASRHPFNPNVMKCYSDLKDEAVRMERKANGNPFTRDEMVDLANDYWTVEEWFSAIEEMLEFNFERKIDAYPNGNYPNHLTHEIYYAFRHIYMVGNYNGSSGKIVVRIFKTLHSKLVSTGLMEQLIPYLEMIYPSDPSGERVYPSNSYQIVASNNISFFHLGLEGSYGT